MLLAIGVLLFIIWMLALTALPTIGGPIHVLLILAITCLVVHLAGRRSSVI